MRVVTEGFERAHRPAGPAEYVPELLTAERQIELAADWPLKVSDPYPNEFPLWLDCIDCGRGVLQLADAHGAAARVTAGELLAAVLRHRVMRHELSLSGARTGPGPCYGAECDHVSHARS